MASREWVLKRNCSLAPRQLALAYSALCAVSFLVAVGCLLRGAWYVLAFAILEMSAVGLAFFLYARHAADRERIALNEDCLLVELIEVERVSQFRLDLRCIRIEPPRTCSALVRLEANGVRVEVGRFLTEWRRRELARELRYALACD